MKSKEVKLLKQQNKQKDEVIHDLDKKDYRGQCESLKLEVKELKKKLKKYEEKFELARISLGKNSNNSCKPSSTNGFKKIIQNNRVKSGRKPGREKGHKRSAPTVTLNADETIKVSKVATCSCGCKTIEKEDVARDLITLEIKVHTKQYVGKKTICPCCQKEYMPNQKVTELLGLLSDGKIKMSQGTVGDTMKQFSNRNSMPRPQQYSFSIYPIKTGRVQFSCFKIL